MRALSSKAVHQQAFTLVEVVIVIVILSIVGAASVAYIRFSAQGYIDVIERQALGQKIYIGFEKVNRLLRSALPNSIRTHTDASHKCLEWIPIVDSGYYLSDVSNPISSIDVVENQGNDFPGLRLAIYPQVADPNELYLLSTTTPITQGIVDPRDLIVGDNKVELNLATEHTFPGSSPQNRFFLVNQPSMLCFVETELFYYRNYGFTDTLSNAIATLPSSVPNRQLIVDQINFNGSRFSYTESFETSNAIVDVALGLPLDTGIQTINQQVHIRNVP